MTFDVDVIRDESCFELPEWKQLLATDPDRHIFATPEWNRTWWDEFGGEQMQLCVLAMRRDGEIAAIVPLYHATESGRQVLRLIGGIDLTDYLGPVCSPGDREDVAQTVAAWLAQERRQEWDELDAHNLPVPLGFAEFLVKHLYAHGLSFSVEQEETSAVLVLPADWETYLRKLRPKDRHELRRKRRRLQAQHPEVTVRTATEDTLEQDLKVFVEMHRGAEGYKGRFMRPEIATFFERIATTLMPRGWLRLDLLEIEGHAIASTFGFELNRGYYLYNSAYEPEVARLSPGVVLVSEIVRRSIENGMERLDFLRGPERYKYQLGAKAVPLNNVRAFNHRPRTQ